MIFVPARATASVVNASVMKRMVVVTLENIVKNAQ